MAGKTDPSKSAKEALQKELEDAAAAEADAEAEPEKIIDGVMRFVLLLLNTYSYYRTNYYCLFFRIFFDPPH